MARMLYLLRTLMVVLTCVALLVPTAALAACQCSAGESCSHAQQCSSHCSDCSAEGAVLRSGCCSSSSTSTAGCSSCDEGCSCCHTLPPLGVPRSSSSTESELQLFAATLIGDLAESDNEHRHLYETFSGSPPDSSSLRLHALVSVWLN